MGKVFLKEYLGKWCLLFMSGKGVGVMKIYTILNVYIVAEYLDYSKDKRNIRMSPDIISIPQKREQLAMLDSPKHINH